MVKILFLAADPIDSARLMLTQEHDQIKEELFRAQSSMFIMEARMATKPTDMIRAILDVKPNIVHFSGHGTSNGELCFLDANNQSKPIPIDALSTLFKLISETVECVVLNACYAESQAKVIANHIKYVIGIRDEISDQASILFSVGFYRALSAGHSYENAFDFGKLEIQMNILGFMTEQILILLKKSSEEQFEAQVIIEPPEGDINEKIDTILSKIEVGIKKSYGTSQWIGSYEILDCSEINVDMAFAELKNINDENIVIN